MTEPMWTNEGEAKGYTLWSRLDSSGRIYNVTNDGNPPSYGIGGSMEYVLRVKGIAVEDLRRV